MMNEDVIMTEEICDDDVLTGEATVEEIAKNVPEEKNITKEDNAEIIDIENLKNELQALRNELLEKKTMLERISKEIGEFSEVFPEKNVNSIPDSVWENVKAGIPLAAAYALYERKNAVRADVAEKTNIINGVKTTGALGRENTENFYTPDEVRAMSRAEVKRNYSKIIDSMKKWN